MYESKIINHEEIRKGLIIDCKVLVVNTKFTSLTGRVVQEGSYVYILHDKKSCHEESPKIVNNLGFKYSYLLGVVSEDGILVFGGCKNIRVNENTKFLRDD